jgi:hypothetical protein
MGREEQLLSTSIVDTFAAAANPPMLDERQKWSAAATAESPVSWDGNARCGSELRDPDLLDHRSKW